MRARKQAVILLFPVAILALAGCSDKKSEPAPEAAVSVEVKTLAQAKAQFLEKVSWDKSNNVRAVIWSDLIGPQDTIEEFGSEAYMHRPLAYQWFLAIDQAPGAYFRHPVNYAYLEFAAPKVQINARTHLPKLNYEKAWTSVSTFLEDQNVVYSNSWLDRPPANQVESQHTPKISNWPPRMSTDACSNERRAYAVLIHNLENLESSPETVENLHMVATSLEASGYSVLQFKDEINEKRPYLNLSGSKGSGIYQLKNFVNIHRDYNDCCEEIVVYITGETQTDKDRRNTHTYFDLPFGYTGESGKRPAAKRFYAEDLATMLADLKTCHVNVVIDSNYASGFMDDLLRIPQIESVIVSCQDNEYTYSSGVETLDSGKFVDPFGQADGEIGSEFTSSLVKGILDHVKAQPARNAHILLKAGFDSVLKNDLAYLADQTLPAGKSRTLNSNCPCGVDTKKDRY